MRTEKERKKLHEYKMPQIKAFMCKKCGQHLLMFGCENKYCINFWKNNL